MKINQNVYSTYKKTKLYKQSKKLKHVLRRQSLHHKTNRISISGIKSTNTITLAILTSPCLLFVASYSRSPETLFLIPTQPLQKLRILVSYSNADGEDDEYLCPKISDFGLAKLCKKKQSVLSLLGTRGTAGYIAPEVFSRNFGGVSHKSDVYSYGMMLLEMAGGKKDGGAVVIQSSENYFPDKIYEKIIIDVTSNLDDESIMVEEEEEKRRKMILVGFWCIQTIPSERPSIYKVVEMLEGSVESIQIPPKPFLSTPVVANQETSSTFSANVETENISGD